MADIPENEFEERTSPASGEAIGMDDLEDWFVREVLPLEAADTRALFKESHMVLDFRAAGMSAWDCSAVSERRH